MPRVVGGLARDGYCIDFARLDAADFGVPQRRIRPFWWGHSRDTPAVRRPERTHCSPEEHRTAALPGIPALRPWVTCRDALGHLSPEELGSPIRLRWRGQNGKKVASSPDLPARVVGTSSLSDGNVLAPSGSIAGDRRKSRDPGRKPRASHFDEPAGVVTSRPNQGDGCTLFDWPNHRPSKLDAPARTLTRNTHSAVKLSEKAAAILQGFPESWSFCGATKTARWSMIGQAMPPPLAEAVAKRIAGLGCCRAERRRRAARATARCPAVGPRSKWSNANVEAQRGDSASSPP